MLLFQANIFDPKGKVHRGATSPIEGSMNGSMCASDMHVGRALLAVKSPRDDWLADHGDVQYACLQRQLLCSGQLHAKCDLFSIKAVHRLHTHPYIISASLVDVTSDTVQLMQCYSLADVYVDHAVMLVWLVFIGLACNIHIIYLVAMPSDLVVGFCRPQTCVIDSEVRNKLAVQICL